MSTLGNITGLDTYKTAANPNRGGLGAFNAAFGNSAEKFAAGRELDEDNEIKANWVDRLFGHSTEELTEEAVKARYKALKADPRADALRAEGKDLDVLTTGGQLAKLTNDLNKLTKARDLASASGYLDLAQLDDTNAILAGIRTKDEEKVKTEKKDARELAKTDLKELYARQDELTRRQNARTDLLNAQTRQDALELRRDNMNLEYARLDRQDRQDAQNRRDQQIMLLVQGLANLGTGFTV